MSYQLPLGTNS